MRIYARIGKVAYRLIRPFWNRWAHNKPRSRLVIVHDNDIFLVKNWLSTQSWRLPGGGRRASEEPVDGAAREAREELGAEIDRSQLNYLGNENVMEAGTTIEAEYFSVELTPEDITVDTKEIIEAKWFSFDELPENRAGVVDNAIALYRGGVDNHANNT